MRLCLFLLLWGVFMAFGLSPQLRTRLAPPPTAMRVYRKALVLGSERRMFFVGYVSVKGV